MIRTVFLSFFVVAALAVSASAADKKPGHRVLQLTLSKAVRFALSKNFSLEAERYSPRIAKERLRTSVGRFDPLLDVTFRHGEDTVRNELRSDILTGQTGRFAVGNTANDDTLSMGITGITPWGTVYDFGASTRRNGGALSQFGDIYQTELTFGLTQPLLRGAGPDVNLAPIRIARNNITISEWALRERAMEIITDVTNVYNELHFAQENLEVAKRSRALAQQLYQDNEKKKNIGVMIGLDVTIAQAGVASREEAVIRAVREVKDQENFLKQLITADLIPLLGTSVEIVPPKAPSFVETVMMGLREALEFRPDYQQAKLDIANRKITVLVEKNSMLPRLDLSASLNLIGVSDSFGSSQARSVSNRDQSGWSGGAVFSYPIGNREARGRYNAATLEATQALVRLQQLEQNIIVVVDNANGAIITAEERIQATAESRRLAKESVDAGEKRLAAGTGTVFEVLQLQDELAQAETAELRAKADYNKAVAQYQLQTGTTLKVYGMNVD